MPDRADINAALAQFHEAGLTPVISTNKGTPDTDIIVMRGEREQGLPWPILSVTITEAGQARLDAVK